MLFAAQLKENDPWQIWEMNLNNLKYRKITTGSENCTDPAYLPGGRIVFSKLTINDTVKKAHCLYTCNSDGSALKQITFNPNDNFATTVLKDGRLLAVSQQLLPFRGDPLFIVMRPDGTKADLFYKGPGESTLVSSISETEDGRLVFIESENEKRAAGKVVSVAYNRPLHTRTELTTDITGDFLAVFPMLNRQISCILPEAGIRSFCTYMSLIRRRDCRISRLFSDPDYNILDVVPAKANERPKKLPSRGGLSR